jgi:hypothetical protein
MMGFLCRRVAKMDGDASAALAAPEPQTADLFTDSSYFTPAP